MRNSPPVRRFLGCLLAGLLAGCSAPPPPGPNATGTPSEGPTAPANPAGDQPPDRYYWGLYLDAKILDQIDGGSTVAQALPPAGSMSRMVIDAEGVWRSEGSGPWTAVSGAEFTGWKYDFDTQSYALPSITLRRAKFVEGLGRPDDARVDPLVRSALALRVFGGARLPAGWAVADGALVVAGVGYTLQVAPGDRDRFVADGSAWTLSRTADGWEAVPPSAGEPVRWGRWARADLVGTWLPQAYLDKWSQTRSHARALAASPYGHGGHDVLGIDAGEVWSNAGYHDGYSLKPDEAARLILDQDGTELTDAEGWEYTRVSQDSRYGDVVAAWVTQKTFGDRGTEVLDGQPWTVELDTFAYPDDIDLVVFRPGTPPTVRGLKMDPVPTLYKLEDANEMKWATGEAVQTLGTGK